MALNSVITDQFIVTARKPSRRFISIDWNYNKVQPLQCVVRTLSNKDYAITSCVPRRSNPLPRTCWYSNQVSLIDPEQTTNKTLCKSWSGRCDGAVTDCTATRLIKVKVPTHSVLFRMRKNRRASGSIHPPTGLSKWALPSISKPLKKALSSSKV